MARIARKPGSRLALASVTCGTDLPAGTLPDPLALATQHLRDGRHAAAAVALIPVLLARAGDGDAACAVAAALLQHNLRLPPIADPAAPAPVTEDHLTRMVERLTCLARQQDEQVATLLDLLKAAS